MFPEGTISLDLEPMVGKSGTARLAQASGVPVTPVGLWGLHRDHVQGAQAARGGPASPRRSSSARRCTSSPDEDVHVATDRIMAAICAAGGAGA